MTKDNSNRVPVKVQQETVRKHLHARGDRRPSELAMEMATMSRTRLRRLYRLIVQAQESQSTLK